MSTHTEWELMVIDCDIEQGDTLVVEKDGQRELMTFVQEVDKNTILLKDASKNKLLFNATSLCEVGGKRFIAGRSLEELRQC
jgi:hypothetical protein